MRDRAVLRRWVPWIAGCAGVAAGWGLGGGEPDRTGEPVLPGKSADRVAAVAAGGGAAMLFHWADKVAETPDAGLPALAAALAKDPRRHDPALWMPLIARWSESDAPAMMAFLELQSPPALREHLLGSGWFAWGAVDPDGAFAAGQALPDGRMRRLLEGVAETDPEKAAAFVVQVPNSQFAAYTIAGKIVRDAPEAADALMRRAVYDGARMSFQRAKIEQLAASDPVGAIAYAQHIGMIGHDPVAQAVEAIAKHDPLNAVAEIAEMPSSRSKALSVVALAKTWVARDPEAALDWVRGQPEGPVRQAALVAAAAVLVAEPEQSLDLVMEAGWTRGGDFHAIKSGSITPSEVRKSPDAMKVAAAALRNWSARDAEAARRYLDETVPEAMRTKLAEEAGMTP